MRTIAEKWRVEDIRTASTLEDNKQKAILHPVGSTNISATIKDLKDVRVVILTTSSFKQLPIWLVKKNRGILVNDSELPRV